MERFVSSILKSIDDKNYFAALFVALAMPDICGALENPNAEVGKRYKKWFDKYLKSKYAPTNHLEALAANFPDIRKILPPDAVAQMSTPFDTLLWFTAEDCLRCRNKFLHQGLLENSQKEKITFITPLPNRLVVHKSIRNGTLVLQINAFAEDICHGVQAWERDVQSDTNTMRRIGELMTFTEWYDL